MSDIFSDLSSMGLTGLTDMKIFEDDDEKKKQAKKKVRPPTPLGRPPDSQENNTRS